MLVGYFSFVIINIHPYVRLIDDTIRLFSGAVIPLAFFPSWLAVIAKAMPFHFMYSFPIRLLLEKLPSEEIYSCFLLMVIWIIALSIALRFAFFAAVKKCILQGG
jgi:ABC-2 type transport system permease protein